MRNVVISRSSCGLYFNETILQCIQWKKNIFVNPIIQLGLLSIAKDAALHCSFEFGLSLTIIPAVPSSGTTVICLV